MAEELKAAKVETKEEKEVRVASEIAKHKEWAGLSAQAKTQLVADERFDGPKKFKVCIPEDKAHPTVTIKANSKEEAQIRYQTVCGIRQTDKEFKVLAA